MRTIFRPTRTRLVAAAAVLAAAGAAAALAVTAPSAGAGGSAPMRQAAVVTPVSPAAASPIPTPSPVATPPPPTVELVTSSNFGPVLTTSAGMTLYRQIAPCSRCAAQYRPLLLASGQQLHKPPLLPGQLGTVRLADGSLQVTFNGSRLFTYTGDRFPEDTNGVSLSWTVIQPVP